MNADQRAWERPRLQWPTPFYAVMVRGDNFLVDVEGAEERRGFLTVRWIEAADEDGAAESAIESVQDDEELGSRVLNDEDDPPVMFIERLDAADPADSSVPATRSSGYGWFPATGDEDEGEDADDGTRADDPGPAVIGRDGGSRAVQRGRGIGPGASCGLFHGPNLWYATGRRGGGQPHRAVLE